MYDNRRIINANIYVDFASIFVYKNKAYIRNDTSTVEVDDIELKRLILNGEHLNYEDNKSDLRDNITKKESEKNNEDNLS